MNILQLATFRLLLQGPQSKFVHCMCTDSKPLSIKTKTSNSLYYKHLFLRESRCHCLSCLFTAMKDGNVVQAMRRSTAQTKVDELSPHGMIVTYMLLVPNSMESGWSGKIGIR